MSYPAYTTLSPKAELDFVTREVFHRQAELKRNMDALNHCSDQVRMYKGLEAEFSNSVSNDMAMLAVMLKRKWALEDLEVLA